jgi:BRCT domain type II-containing protein
VAPPAAAPPAVAPPAVAPPPAVSPPPAAASSVDGKGALSGKSVVFTGVLAGLSRGDAEDVVKSHGGKVH